MFSKADIWRSALRARDIQLMLRASRLFPRRHDMTGATKDDLMRVEMDVEARTQRADARAHCLAREDILLQREPAEQRA